MIGGFDLLSTLGMEVIEGRNFSRESVPYGDIIINETAVKIMGMNDPVGQIIKVGGQDVQIIGVLKDFFFESMHTPMHRCIIGLPRKE